MQFSLRLILDFFDSRRTMEFRTRTSRSYKISKYKQYQIKKYACFNNVSILHSALSKQYNKILKNEE